MDKYSLRMVKLFNDKHDVDIDGQSKMLSAEVGELNDAILRDDKDGIKEEIGDVMFVAISIAHLYEIDVAESLIHVCEENMGKDKSKEGNKVTKA
jgi:NTP pyrophosphatase (non-canonical NTP hydrolase)